MLGFEPRISGVVTAQPTAPQPWRFMLKWTPPQFDCIESMKRYNAQLDREWALSH